MGMENDAVSIDQLNKDSSNEKEDISLYDDSLEMEPLPAAPNRLNKKRDVQPFFELVFGILDTMHSASKQTVRRAKEKNIQRIF